MFCGLAVSPACPCSFAISEQNSITEKRPSPCACVEARQRIAPRIPNCAELRAAAHVGVELADVERELALGELEPKLLDDGAQLGDADLAVAVDVDVGEDALEQCGLLVGELPVPEQPRHERGEL